MDEDEWGRCAVCTERVKGEEEASLDGCLHRFHFNCVATWGRISNACPLCKAIFHKVTRLEHGSYETFEDRKIPVQPMDPHEAEVLMQLYGNIDDIICNFCGDGGDEPNMLLCESGDACDFAAHWYCCEGLKGIPEGEWFCQSCTTPTSSSSTRSTSATTTSSCSSTSSTRSADNQPGSQSSPLRTSRSSCPSSPSTLEMRTTAPRPYRRHVQQVREDPAAMGRLRTIRSGGTQGHPLFLASQQEEIPSRPRVRSTRSGSDRRRRKAKIVTTARRPRKLLNDIFPQSARLGRAAKSRIMLRSGGDVWRAPYVSVSHTAAAATNERLLGGVYDLGSACQSGEERAWRDMSLAEDRRAACGRRPTPTSRKNKAVEEDCGFVRDGRTFKRPRVSSAIGAQSARQAI
jgi:hypothetical protein